jgi:hypothetical protein
MREILKNEVIYHESIVVCVEDQQGLTPRSFQIRKALSSHDNKEKVV